ncbi:DUF5988 family protein [Streptomyces sp. NPDC097619]|uniref:DUF5988 family protein n=1 Tax=Streptomyces sp. NPDC097619 TaxID=3157228 RepID=UPI00332DE46D
MTTREALLEGGPADIPHRHTISDDDPDRIRVRRLAGYEHYEFTGTYRTQGPEHLPVYRWIYSTRIAE